MDTKIEINGFQVPASFHQSLNLLIDAVRYGDISMLQQDVRFNPKGTSLDKHSPVGYFLTEEQRADYVRVEHPVEQYGEVNFEAMTSLKVNDLIEIQTWFDTLKETATEDNANEVRLEMIEWLEALKQYRPDYPNPATV